MDFYYPKEYFLSKIFRYLGQKVFLKLFFENYQKLHQVVEVVEVAEVAEVAEVVEVANVVEVAQVEEILAEVEVVEERIEEIIVKKR